MRILVTGASGFIGSHLVPELIDHEVVGSDRVDADLAEPGEAAALLERTDPDYVVHLAARYGRILCRDAPHESVVDNAAATTELAALCAERRISVLYASSSEVYGDHGEDWITEHSELRTPTTIYGLSKRWGEEALRLYLPPEQLCIVRMNMVYGPGQRGGYGCCALATFIRDALEGRTLKVHVAATRSWLYISDAVRALRLLIGHTGVWNVGHPYGREPVETTAQRVIDEVGQGDIGLSIPPAGQIAHKNYEVGKLGGLGWEPEVDLSEGIRRTVEAARTTPIVDYEGALA